MLLHNTGSSLMRKLSMVVVHNSIQLLLERSTQAIFVILHDLRPVRRTPPEPNDPNLGGNSAAPAR